MKEQIIYFISVRIQITYSYYTIII